ncbi:hypothetical protein K788_0000501 [Paraburkholderia caribensis MBA4]|uniref:Uncharacterized protein n=1 Tax=Paraburkholderia caribensis MBA4 TaxID=1323664 RepID=A0A0N7JV77_9BURK|nr:hypothetical protein K788_0000501 [Paraburkholderia caribensis MBA4]
MDDHSALELVGQLIDYAGDTASACHLDRAVEWCQQLEARNLTDLRRIDLDYYAANAWAHRAKWRHKDKDAAWVLAPM